VKVTIEQYDNVMTYETMDETTVDDVVQRSITVAGMMIAMNGLPPVMIYRKIRDELKYYTDEPIKVTLSGIDTAQTAENDSERV